MRQEDKFQILFHFLKNFETCGGKSIPIPFCKISKLSIPLYKYAKLSTFCFVCVASRRLSKYIETKLSAFAFASDKIFLKNKKRSRTSLPGFFST